MVHFLFLLKCGKFLSNLIEFTSIMGKIEMKTRLVSDTKILLFLHVDMVGFPSLPFSKLCAPLCAKLENFRNVLTESIHFLCTFNSKG